ncbi:MAG: hypothetical protein A3G34_03475 [Candidatus Lindowbacteria bacterium RIFCSPLOWO2_12_FULL_62_27]|nr:MAG: hypothetical protein A3G34_03475 [Candidatus Lindowbacteria bacterium RIFCSPLOWO2_12_FULL_62_27]OGH62139.1 MAG: hypothetical protein A3I06_09820 [Candidatus Lindowbacteria bacterium RIFCSPLOWO2_02_FULL_62_12]
MSREVTVKDHVERLNRVLAYIEANNMSGAPVWNAPRPQRLVLAAILKEVIPMNPEFRDMPERQVLYVRKTGEYSKAAGAAWEALMKAVWSKFLFNRRVECIGIPHDNPNVTPEENLRYDACVDLHKAVKPKGDAGVQAIAGGKYAVFLHAGPYEKLGETYNAIFSQWLPSSGAKLRDVPGYEIYLNNPKRTKPENLKTEICVPVAS